MDLFTANLTGHFYLKPFSINLNTGDCVQLTGSSGSGKSLLLRVLADLDSSERSMRLAGTDCDAMPAASWRRQVMWFPSQPQWWSTKLADHFPASEHWQRYLLDFGLLADANQADHWLQRSLNQCSSGEKQRLALIRGLLREPKVLLLDEPTANLDHEYAELAMSLLSDYVSKQKAAAIIVSHQPERTRPFCNRLLSMVDGALDEA